MRDFKDTILIPLDMSEKGYRRSILEGLVNLSVIIYVIGLFAFEREATYSLWQAIYFFYIGMLLLNIIIIKKKVSFGVYSIWLGAFLILSYLSLLWSISVEYTYKMAGFMLRNTILGFLMFNYISSLKSIKKQLVQHLEITDKVRFLGYRDDIPSICSASDIFLFPSRQEGLPVSMMEAMASGMPIVCSRIRGNIDLIQDGEGGFLYSPDDVAGFKECIERLINDKMLAKKMAQINSNKIERFDIKVVNEIMAEVYREVLKP